MQSSKMSDVQGVELDISAIADDGESLEKVKTRVLTKEEMQRREKMGKEHKDGLESRTALSPTGNPEATIADPMMQKVVPRYNIVQNQSNLALIVPDLKTNPDDTGLMLYPGEVIKLTDFYSPMEINRSKGLRYAASVLKGIGDAYALIPLQSEDEGKNFRLPERQKYPKGTVIEDPIINDFDRRFDELEIRDAKREEKLLKKTLAGRTTRMHGAAPVHV